MKLSMHEKRLVYLIIRGYSNPKLAEIFGCSLSKIKILIRILYGKTEVETRLGLIRKYYENPDLFECEFVLFQGQNLQEETKAKWNI